MAVLGELGVMPMTGYALRQGIRNVLGHFWSESFGPICPALAMLENGGVGRRQYGSDRPDRRNIVTVAKRLQAVVDRAGRDRQLTGTVVVAVEHPASGLVWAGVDGECRPDIEFLIASTTKPHTSAIVLHLDERSALRLDDRLVDVVDRAEVLDGLHVIRGVDRTGEIAIRHLMAQTSGLGDYFQGKSGGGSSLETKITGGTGCGWDCRAAR